MSVNHIRAVHKPKWRPVTGMRSTRKLVDGRPLKQWYRKGPRGQSVYLQGIEIPLSVSWFWLKRSTGKQELRFVGLIYPYSGAYLVRLGRKRWAIESFFKTVRQRRLSRKQNPHSRNFVLDTGILF